MGDITLESILGSPYLWKLSYRGRVIRGDTRGFRL